MKLIKKIINYFRKPQYTDKQKQTMAIIADRWKKHQRRQQLIDDGYDPDTGFPGATTSDIQGMITACGIKYK